MVMFWRIIILVRSWNFKDGGCFKVLFLAKNQRTQRIFFKSYDELQFVKKQQNYTFIVNFRCQKSINFFQSFSFLFKNINLGDHFIVKIFFLNSIFEPFYFLKLCQIFDELTFLVGSFF